MSKALEVAGPDQQTSGLQPSGLQPSSLQRATGGPQRLITFLKDVRQEMRKVVVPSRAIVQSTTIVVIVTVFIFAIYFEVVDLVLGKSIDRIFAALIK